MTRAVDGFEELLLYLKTTRGFDFTGYKRASLQRRVGKRMDMLSIERFADYQDYLEVRPDEFPQLFDAILINVTSFFRDAPVWDAIRSDVIPQIQRSRAGTGPIRVWSAGCATGEEAYTAAIVFAEALGMQAFQERVKVYATDVDEDALTTARQGVYSAKDVEAIPPELREKYFEPLGSRFTFNKDMRRSVIFGRHDLVQDAPISRLDLLMCRNTLMYFNSDLQNRILRNFHFALSDQGFLLLGKAETMLAHGTYFEPADLRQRLFAKVSGASQPERMLALRDHGGEPLPLSRQVQMRDAAIDAAPLAQVIIDVDGILLVASQQARALFDLGTADVGRPIQDLELSYKPLELRSRIETAYAERRPVQVTNVDRPYGDGDTQSFDVTVAPVVDAEGNPLGVTVTFTDVTRYRRLRRDLERSNQELETAYEELQSTNEELETANEELQSTIEELETTNEELQSANEELETTNEELQSTNAEMQSMTEDARQRAYELHRVAALSEGVLSSMHVAVVVLDAQQKIVSWNEHMVEMFGVRAEEVAGHELTSLDIGLPLREFVDPIRRCLRGEAQRFEVTATNRRGRQIRCRVSCTPLAAPEAMLYGAVIVIEDADVG
jgi:two-component system CheB/CheR fusion protein